MKAYRNIVAENDPCIDGQNKFISYIGTSDGSIIDSKGIESVGLNEACWYVLQTAPEKLLECHAEIIKQTTAAKLAVSLEKQIVAKDPRLAQTLAEALINYHGESTVKNWLIEL
jgi:hypothetical protein